MAQLVRDMTRGKPGRLILSFALPLMIGNLFQQMYIMVDTMVVGQFVGVEALAALGAVDWFHWLVTGIITGTTQGFSVLIAQRFGAQDWVGLRRALSMSVALTVLCAVVTTAGGLLSARGALIFLHTPENILDLSHLYISIIFSGLAAVSGYNLCAAILRALGNGRAPLYAMMLAASLNVGLDLLFVVVFQWGVAGAAIATVISQVVSFLICLVIVCRIPQLRLKKQDWSADIQIAGRLGLLGMPVAFQNIIIAVGGMAVQSVVNEFGFVFVAGFTATNKLYGLLEVAAISFGFSMTTYAGQNLGAKRLDRIRQGIRAARRMAVAVSLVITALMLVLGRRILLLFISGEAAVVEQAADIGYHYLAVMSAALSILYLLHVYRSALQGMGDTLTPMISGVVEMGMRIAVVLILPIWIGEWGVYLAEVAAWLGAAVLLMASYYRRIRRLEREGAGTVPPPLAEKKKNGI